MSEQPFSYSVKGAVAASGKSRASLYNAKDAGKLDFRKDGKKTIIIGDSLRNYILSLPPLPPKKRTAITP
jgi:hypothetical protein